MVVIWVVIFWVASFLCGGTRKVATETHPVNSYPEDFHPRQNKREQFPLALLNLANLIIFLAQILPCTSSNFFFFSFCMELNEDGRRIVVGDWLVGGKWSVGCWLKLHVE